MSIMDFKAVCFIVIVLLCLHTVAGRGGRGGGRGGYRGGRSSYRSSRSYRSAYSGHRISSSSSVRSALLLGTVYGATRWRVRRPNYYHSDGDLPTICYNDKYVSNVYKNVSYYGRFVCPMDYQDDDKNYCCGEEGLQTCCGFWDDGGRIAGVVIGIIIGVAGLFTVVICLCCYFKKRNARQSSRTPAMSWNVNQNRSDVYKDSMKAEDTNNVNGNLGYNSPMYGVQPPAYTPSAPQENGYPVQPGNEYSAPYPTGPANGYSAPYATQFSDNSYPTK